MKIYKFLLQSDWPVLIMAKDKANAERALYRMVQDLSHGHYCSFVECMSDFIYNGTIIHDEARAMLLSKSCDANFGIEKIERKAGMKIHIDNHSRLDIAEASQIVTDLLRREREFMLANTVGGCHFKARDIVIGLLPVCKEYPAGEMCFYVLDEKKEGKAK